MRIAHSGSKAQYKGNTRNHALQDPHVYVVFGGALCMIQGSGYSSLERTLGLSGAVPHLLPKVTVLNLSCIAINQWRIIVPLVFGLLIPALATVSIHTIAHRFYSSSYSRSNNVIMASMIIMFCV